MKALYKLLLGFKFAFEGLWFCLKSCRNFRIHIVAAFFVIYLSGFYRLTSIENCIVYIIISIVLSLECLNTALEQLCDSISTEPSVFIKHAKDAGAAAVLLAAICSVLIFIKLFYKPDIILELLNYFGIWYRLLILFLSIIISIIFIFYEDIFNHEKK